MKILEAVLLSNSGSLLDTFRFFWDQAGPEMLAGAVVGACVASVRAWTLRSNRWLTLSIGA